MFNIATYLEKFKNIGSSENSIKDIIISSLNEILKITVTRKEIRLQNGTAYIQTSPLVKNQLYIKKDSILSHISQKTDKVKDIR